MAQAIQIFLPIRFDVYGGHMLVFQQLSRILQAEVSDHRILLSIRSSCFNDLATMRVCIVSKEKDRSNTLISAGLAGAS
jgi:hypothetical protein